MRTISTLIVIVAASMRAAAGEPVVVEPAAARLARRTDGSVVWEAEWAESVEGTWSILPDESAAGGAALFCLADSQRERAEFQNAPEYPEHARGVATYRVPIPRTGSYYLAGRIQATDGCGDSMFVVVGERVGSVRYPPSRPSERVPFGAWGWNGERRRTYALSAGTVRVRVLMREDGFHVDQLALVPEGAARPDGLATTTRGPSVRQGGRLEAGLWLRSCILWPDVQPATKGALWLRSNADRPVTARASLAFPDGTVKQGTEFVCTLEADRPVALVPLDFSVARGAARRWYRVQVEVKDASGRGRTITRRRNVCRPFDWRVAGPCDITVDRRFGKALKGVQALDNGGPPRVQGGPAWQAPRFAFQFGPYGALDLARFFGELPRSSAYIATRLRVERAGAYRLVAGGDDALKLRLDGEVLFVDEDEVAMRKNLRVETVELTRGDHVLIGRVWQVHRWWDAHVEFQERDGSATSHVVGLPMK